MTERACDGLAIVGLAAASGTLGDRLAFERGLLAGTDPGTAPIGASEPALLRRLALEALADAGEPDRRSVGLVTISGTYATDQLAGYLARGIELGGGARAVVVGPLSWVDALDAAVNLLLEAPTSGTPPCQAVLIASANGGGEGSALVLMRGEDVGDQPVLATIDGWARGRSSADAAAAALASASAGPGDIGYLRACGGSDAASALAPVFGPEATTAAIDVGRSAATSIAAAALCLAHRAIPTCAPPADPDLASPFYAPPDARPWFAPPSRPGRAAGVFLSCAAEHALIVLGEQQTRRARTDGIRLIAPTRLVPLAAVDGPGLLARIAALEESLNAGADPADVAREACADSQLAASRGGAASLAVALIGRSREELLSEVAAARRGMPVALERGEEWRTAHGSAFAPRPAGPTGGVAFVYPGAFSAYVGAARAAFSLFPWAMDDLVDFRSDLGEAFHDRLLYPRTSGRWSPAAQAAADGRLAADALAMIESGTMVATLHTRALRRVFGIEPAHALGYSLGEVMMLVALGVWSDGDAAQRRLVESPLFTTELVGPKRAVRRLWGLRPEATLEWGGRVLLASRERVEAQLRPDERVYVTIANAPEETVVAGDAAACARLAERVGCDSVPSPFDHVLHCPATMLEVDEFARHMRHPHRPVAGIQFHSAGSAAPLDSDVERTAATLAQMSCRQLDFVGLVGRVYAAGARVFIEVGPGATTTRLIQAALRGRPHLAVSISRRGQDDQSAWLRALAILVTHRVPVDLGALARA